MAAGQKAYPLGASYARMQRARLVEFADQGFDVAADRVADSADCLEILTGGIFQCPIFIALAGIDPGGLQTLGQSVLAAALLRG